MASILLHIQFSGWLWLICFSAFLLHALTGITWFYRLFRYSARQSADSLPPVSIVICSRNNLSGLQNLIPQLLRQSYHEFDIIVVDDNSSDRTWEYLEKLKEAHPSVKTLRLSEKKHPGKKHALSEGVQLSGNEWIVVTDSDCVPASDHWLEELMKNASIDTQLILGYGPYKKYPGLLNCLVRWDTVQIAIQYMSSALNGNAYMGVGRNMAYRKSMFRETGLRKHWDLISGDDDLLVQEFSPKTNIRLAMSPQSVTLSEPKSGWWSWMRQKARHISTSSRYKFKNQILLAVFPLTSLFFYLSLFIIVITGNPLAAFCLLMIRAVHLWILYAPLLGKFHEKDLIPYIPLLDLIYTFVLPVIGLTNLLIRNRKWN